MSEVQESIRIGASRERVFEAYVAEIDAWWPRQGRYRYSFAPAGHNPAPAYMAFEAREGGRLFERFEDGSEFEIGRITVWEPPRRLVYTWQAPDWPAHTVIDVQLREVGDETEVTVLHSGFGENGVPDLAEGYAAGSREILASFAAWVAGAR
jgi:uncharacterized protein YndB with AHSA1/START domain